MTIDKYDSAKRLIKVATGDEYGNSYTVTDMGIGISEPGYGDKDTFWVAGNWNDRTKYVDGERIVTDNTPSRLATALERIGVELLWLDEWMTCTQCFQAIRNQADSYSWTPHYLTGEDDYEPYCLDCFDQYYSDDDSGLRDFDYVDNPRRAVPDSISDAQLKGWGWESYNGTYENGWHPGQTDDPTEIFEAIKSAMPEHEVVFRYSPSQFYVSFTAWIKPATSEVSA